MTEQEHESECGLDRTEEGWTDEDLDGFVVDTFMVRPQLAEDASVYADDVDQRVTFIAEVVSIEWDLWNGYTDHPDAPEPYVEMHLDDRLVAAVRRYIDRH